MRDERFSGSDPIWGPPIEHASCDLVLGATDLRSITEFVLEQAKVQDSSKLNEFPGTREIGDLAAWGIQSGCVLANHLPFISKEISGRFRCTVMSVLIVRHCGIYSWKCDLFRAGEYLDRHWSCPDVHGLPVKPKNRADYLDAFQGKPEVFAEALGGDVNVLKQYLVQIPERRIYVCKTSRTVAYAFKAFPDDAYTLAGGWSWLDMLRRTGHGDMADVWKPVGPSYEWGSAEFRKPDRYFNAVINEGALRNKWTSAWQAPLAKPGVTEDGQECFMSDYHGEDE